VTSPKRPAGQQQPLLVRHGVAMRVVGELEPEERIALLLEVVSAPRP
jgi:hypothetical protein